MKYLLSAILVAGLTYSSQAQQHTLTKLWETEAVLKVPESVLADPAAGILYVSIIEGSPSEADGKGGVAKVSTDGKVINADWITGLNAPKGLGRFGNLLYVADMNDLVIVNISSGKIEKKITVAGSKMLNDITVDENGTLYIADSGNGTIFKIEKETPSVFLSGLTAINGVKAVGKDLYFVSGTTFNKADQSKAVTKVAEGFVPRLDGIEPVKNGDFLITSWSGVVYYVHKDGKLETLLDTRDQGSNTADLGFDPAKGILYIPTFAKNSVAAYILK